MKYLWNSRCICPSKLESESEEGRKKELMNTKTLLEYCKTCNMELTVVLIIIGTIRNSSSKYLQEKLKSKKSKIKQFGP